MTWDVTFDTPGTYEIYCSFNIEGVLANVGVWSSSLERPEPSCRAGGKPTQKQPWRPVQLAGFVRVVAESELADDELPCAHIEGSVDKKGGDKADGEAEREKRQNAAAMRTHEEGERRPRLDRGRTSPLCSDVYGFSSAHFRNPRTIRPR